ncbi:MAG: lipopolysaccharide transport system permease protein [Thermoleophilaceae bacterium]|nr:lipopolysaccharide transport system permease protein [Thermoleophilaceae bacterium]
MTAVPPAARGQGEITVIQPDARLALPSLREVWAYRDLLYFLVRRDFIVRYKQTLAGVLWSVIQPIGFTVVFSIFLGSLSNVRSQEGVPYPLFALSGLAMWLFFTKALSSSAESTVNSADLLSKVYFPRILIPLSALIAATLDFAVALVVVVIAMFLYEVPPGPEILAMPLVIALAMVVALGGGLWFSALYVRYRDIQHLLAFILLAGMFVTPIVYPFQLVPAAYQPLYALNPMVGVIELYRWALFGDLTVGVGVLAIPLVTGTIATITGAFYYRRAERTFADVI